MRNLSGDGQLKGGSTLRFSITLLTLLAGKALMGERCPGFVEEARRP